ncbi:hypothetical protein IFM89_008829 [Coptis chinensis]|uniref:Cucumisin n=1 Tax=Coptis chinensis TaxID=261450 RepID=A0A835LI03_9MAGN|nr:hypothetical protein IFM89_008829 [Coptis chinensis]
MRTHIKDVLSIISNFSLLLNHRSSSPVESLIYTYKKSFNGFAAWLTEQESKKLLGTQGVISVFPSKTLKTQTTRSWDFWVRESRVKRIPEGRGGVIIGLIDTESGESESFNDIGMGVPPKKWKGICQNITCNNKIIGARFYKGDQDFHLEEERSPRDFQGHGTHTASTAARREVKNVSYYGFVEGTARGAVPSAKIVVYKVSWKTACMEHDILTAFDDAIADGVDILSVSIGREDIYSADYSQIAIAVGAFHAMQHGILTSASGGDRGFLSVTVQSGAPWMLIVAASTTDRKFIMNITLGNNKTLTGPAINVFPTSEKFYPYGFCLPGEMNPNLTKGNIVFCNPTDLGIDGSGPLVYGAYRTIMIAHYGRMALAMGKLTTLECFLHQVGGPCAYLLCTWLYCMVCLSLIGNTNFQVKALLLQQGPSLNVASSHRLWSTSTRCSFLVSIAFEHEGILRFVTLSDGSCYLHDWVILWPCYCTFQGTQRQNIALDDPPSCLVVMGFILDFSGKLVKFLNSSRYVFISILFEFSEVDVWGYRQPTIVLELMGKHALMIYIFAACNLLPLFLHGFYWKRPENNILTLIGVGL